MKTQKAKGIIKGLGAFLGSGKRGNFLHEPEHVLVQNEEAINYDYLTLPAFARPCPKTPKHGFVESRKIDNKEQLLSLWKEVKEKDPNGEIILGQNFDQVEYNSIYVSSGQLSIGEGNDGATGGKNSINFPVAPFNFSKTFRKSIGISQADAIYIEAIKAMREYDYESFWYLTQMRGGPEIKGVAVDYVPKTMKVNKVIVPSHNLIEWEKTCKNMEDGTVVYGDGYTLASHAGVHCIINKIPFLTSREPEVGENLKPVANTEPKLTTDLFRKGTNAGMRMMKNIEPQKAFYFSVSVLHNWAYLRNSEHASWLLGAASTMYAQLCTAMIFGEYRHCKTCQKHDWHEREAIYDDVFVKIHSYIPKINKLIRCFHLCNWESGYGGLPWATCSWYSYSLWKSISEVYNSKRKYLKDTEIAKVMGSINNTTNLAHHNGWWFNKFVEKEDMDFLATEPGIAALSVSDIYFSTYNEVKKLNKVKVKFTDAGNVKVPFSKDKDGKILWCVVNLKNTDDWDYTKNTVSVEIFREDGSKKKNKKIKFNELEYKMLLKKAKQKGIPVNKNISLPVVKDKITLPNGKKVVVK